MLRRKLVCCWSFPRRGYRLRKLRVLRARFPQEVGALRRKFIFDGCFPLGGYRLRRMQVFGRSFPQIVGVLWKKRCMNKYLVGCGCCVNFVKKKDSYSFE